MKFFTKKTKIVFLVIILIGAVLLAYNSLSYQLDYQPLKGNSSSLGSSLITEGFNGSGTDSSGNSYYDEIRNNMQKSFEAIAASNAANGCCSTVATISKLLFSFIIGLKIFFNIRPNQIEFTFGNCSKEFYFCMQRDNVCSSGNIVPTIRWQVTHDCV